MASKSENEVGAFGFGLWLGAVLMAFLIWVFVEPKIVTDAHCAAIGGTTITNYTCNVNGKVVTF